MSSQAFQRRQQHLFPRAADTLLAQFLHQRFEPRALKRGHLQRERDRNVSNELSSWFTNRQLSLRRADSVRSALISRGVKEGGISVAGRGEAEPAVPTADGVREPANRRVEIILL